jgi:DNA repair protein RecN (Recombination protein N)
LRNSFSGGKIDGHCNMLTTLRIKNLALVEDLTLELQPGFNVITGETGAGKSILIGALNLLLGERADRGFIRNGSDSCSVEGIFDLHGLKAPLEKLLDENGLEPCQDFQLILRRSLTASGVNRQFVNGSPTTLSVLASIGEWLADIHGPHEHQSLLQPARQLALLDAFGALEPAREAFAELVRQRTALEAEKNAWDVDEKTHAQQIELLRFQVGEIDAARLQPGEEEEVTAKFQRSNNAARLLQLSRMAQELLNESDNSVMTQAGMIGRTLKELQKVDGSVENLVALHEQSISNLNDLQAALSEYAEKIDLDPEALQILEERLNVIHALKRKYGSHVPDILAYAEEIRPKLRKLEQRESELSRLNSDLKKLDDEILGAGRELSAQRRKLIPRLGKVVNAHLAELGFKQSRFDIVLTSNDGKSAGEQSASYTSNGLDSVEFQFAPNAGEPPRPLRAIASSGELARVMLALKTVLAAQDQVPVLVFDEVDANVGGETANAVAEKMRRIAQNRQVLCITHLPQVAAPASAHYVATKQTRAGRTISTISLLRPGERITELARMLGGGGEAARRHAKALLNDEFRMTNDERILND